MGYRFPFIQWAGGKAWFFYKFRHLIPKEYSRYIDPFFGGGAIFFLLNPKMSIVNDIDKRLISMYEVLKESPYVLTNLVREHKENHNKKYYDTIKNMQFKNKKEAAAQLIYIVQCSYNGLYDYNPDGTFKSHWSKNKIQNRFCDYNHMLRLSNQFKKTTIYNIDYSYIIPMAERGDFLFVDPPYGFKNHNAIDYGLYKFNTEDQIKLSYLLIKAKERGVKIISTNSAIKELTDLYKDNFNLLYVNRKTGFLSRKNNGYNNYMEIIITGNV